MTHFTQAEWRPWLLHIRCAAHTLQVGSSLFASTAKFNTCWTQLTIKDLLKEPNFISRSERFVKDILALFSTGRGSAGTRPLFGADGD